MDFAVPADQWVKFKENEKKNKYLDFSWELKKLWNMKVTVIPIGIEMGGLGNKIANCSIIEISQNTEKYPGALRRFAVAQTLETIG